jgi:hypothetical protein
MDITFIEQNILEKKEHMNENSIFPSFSALSNIILGIVAVYLCWKRNTEQKESNGMKIIYCIIAFYFPLIYLIYYFVTRKKKTD